jgi:hypothetical protein
MSVGCGSSASVVLAASAGLIGQFRKHFRSSLRMWLWTGPEVGCICEEALNDCVWRMVVAVGMCESGGPCALHCGSFTGSSSDSDSVAVSSDTSVVVRCRLLEPLDATKSVDECFLELEGAADPKPPSTSWDQPPPTWRGTGGRTMI